MFTPPINSPPSPMLALEKELTDLLDEDDQERIPPVAEHTCTGALLTGPPLTKSPFAAPLFTVPQPPEPQPPEPQVPELHKAAAPSTSLAYQFTEKIKNSGTVTAAEKVFEKLEEQKIPIDSYHFNALMYVYVQHRPSKAYTIIPRMEALGIHPTRNTYNILIEACAKCKNLKNAKEIYFDILPKKKIEPDEITFNSMLKVCKKCREVGLARELYTKSTLQASSVTLHLLVQILCDSPDPQEAYSLFEKATSVVTPQWNTYTLLINHFAKHNLPGRVRDVYQKMPQGLKLDSPTYFAVLKSFAMLKDKEGANRIYNALIVKENLPDRNFLSQEIDSLVEAKEISAAEIIYSLFYRYKASEGHTKERLRCERMSGNVAYLFMRNYLSKKKGKGHFVVFLNQENINQFKPLLTKHHSNTLHWEIKRNNTGFEVFIHPI